MAVRGSAILVGAGCASTALSLYVRDSAVMLFDGAAGVLVLVGLLLARSESLIVGPHARLLTNAALCLWGVTVVTGRVLRFWEPGLDALGGYIGLAVFHDLIFAAAVLLAMYAFTNRSLRFLLCGGLVMPLVVGVFGMWMVGSVVAGTPDALDSFVLVVKVLATVGLGFLVAGTVLVGLGFAPSEIEPVRRVSRSPTRLPVSAGEPMGLPFEPGRRFHAFEGPVHPGRRAS